MNSIKNFFNDETGVTAIEYGLIAALVAVGITASVTTIGAKIKIAFAAIATALGG